jgi:hypothetical protein
MNLEWPARVAENFDSISFQMTGAPDLHVAHLMATQPGQQMLFT